MPGGMAGNSGVNFYGQMSKMPTSNFGPSAGGISMGMAGGYGGLGTGGGGFTYGMAS